MRKYDHRNKKKAQRMDSILCAVFTVLMLAFIILMGVDLARSEEVCPQDDNGNDMIQCPQPYGETPGIDRGTPPGEKKKVPASIAPVKKNEVEDIIQDILATLKKRYAIAEVKNK